MSLLPELKKKISDFVFEEEGQISKASLIGLGILAGVTLIRAVSVSGQESITKVEYSQGEIIGAHALVPVAGPSCFSCGGCGGCGGSCSCYA